MLLEAGAIAALQTLADVLTNEGTDLVMIGATVPMVLIDAKQGRGGGRTTRDVDVVITAATWEEFAAIKRRLTSAGFRQGEEPQRLYFGTGIEIDLIPYSPTLAPDDRLHWPGTDLVMSTLGMAEAFECAKRTLLDSKLELPMVPVPGCVLLKLIAYHDRPEERVRDLKDVVYCFEHYEEDSERRFEIAVGASVDGVDVQFEEAGAYLLGCEVADIARRPSLAVIDEVVGGISDEFSRPIQQIFREQGRLGDDEGRRRALWRLFRVFSAALGRQRGNGTAGGSARGNRS